MSNTLKYSAMKKAVYNGLTIDKAAYGLTAGHPLNTWYRDLANSVDELVQRLRDYYNRTGITWEQNPYTVRVYRIVKSHEGFCSLGDIVYEDTTASFWANPTITETL